VVLMTMNLLLQILLLQNRVREEGSLMNKIIFN
jgi:isoprenylcysteine carboxyl methyltransferase (ICMT) family protein YpbQ